MSEGKYGPFFDILSFFIVNGESIKHQWGPEFITGSDEHGEIIKVKVRPAGKAEFSRPELAKTEAQFAAIFARELARTGIEDPAFNRSETVKRITKLMADFSNILDYEFPGIKKQDPAYIEMRRVIELFSLYNKTQEVNSTEDPVNKISSKSESKVITLVSVILAHQILGHFNEGEALTSPDVCSKYVVKYGVGKSLYITKSKPNTPDYRTLFSEISKGLFEKSRGKQLLTWFSGIILLLKTHHPKAIQSLNFANTAIEKIEETQTE